jgi:hypothetical protein
VTTEIIARVDACLAQSTSPVLWLLHDWVALCRELATRDTNRSRQSIKAAMTGILLEIVREAWGGESVDVLLIHCGPKHDSIHECSVSIRVREDRRFLGLGDDSQTAISEALVFALEAAP